MQVSAIKLDVRSPTSSPINVSKLVDHFCGYPSTVAANRTAAFSANTSEYAEVQKAENDKEDR